eukprot:scpid90252/ scgid7753/ 
MQSVLSRPSIPDKLIVIIRSFHDDMSASIRLGADLLELFPVGNGLRQGCTMAPIMGNLFTGAMVERWRATIVNDEDIGSARVNARIKECGRVRSTQCQFADDSSLFANTYNGAERALTMFQEVAGSLFRPLSQSGQNQVHADGCWCCGVR